MKKIFSLIITVLYSSAAFAQESNIWYFGEKAGLDFSSGSPLPLPDCQLSSQEACASIADGNGELLFYTDSNKVWNKNHAIMLNGNGLFGNHSTSQVQIIPKPGNPGIYYIFTIDHLAGPKGLCYSVVDMSMDGGLGQVVTKNVPLVAPVTEKVTAGWHSNGTDIWILAHGWNNNSFYAFKITALGVSDPVISNAGSIIGGNVSLSQGCMRISSQGNHLAINTNLLNIQLFNFDNTAGIVSSPVTLNSIGGYGVEFSPSGNLLYATERLGKIWQYDLSTADISGSAVLLGSTNGAGTLQIGPDHKIYMANIWDLLSVINNPDVPGAGCGLVLNSIDIGSRQAWMGLPAFLPPQFSIYNLDYQDLCLGNAVKFSYQSSIEQPLNTHWDFGDGTFSSEHSPQHSFATAGTYLIKLTVSWNGMQRSLERLVTITQAPVAHTAPDMVICDSDGDQEELFDLSQQDVYVLGGQSATDHTVTYYLTAEDALAGMNNIGISYQNTNNPEVIYSRVTNTATGCYDISSFRLKVVPKPVLEMNHKYYICNGNPVQITAPEGFNSYLWSSGETSRVIAVQQPGLYNLTVFLETEGVICETTTEIYVEAVTSPEIYEIQINDWYIRENSIHIIASGENNEYSIDGIHFQEGNTFEGLKAGLYTVIVRNQCGIATKNVAVLMYPLFFTPNGDGFNDTWHIPYSRLEPGMSINIFDRYGKLITSFDGRSMGWDGKYQGRELPSTDYWFVVLRQDGRICKGHFAMIR